MRLTTKIILGVITSILALSILFIISFSFSERERPSHSYPSSINIPQDNKTGIEIAPFRVVVLDIERTDALDYYYHFEDDSCGLFLKPTTAGEANKLFIPETLSGFITAQTKNDTLSVGIKVDELRKKYSIADSSQKQTPPQVGTMYFISISGVNLHLYTSNVNVINNIDRLSVKMNGIETDSIKIISAGNVLIDSCKATVIDPHTQNHSALKIKNSTAKAFNLDLDVIKKWQTVNCLFEEENLTGSNKHTIYRIREPGDAPSKINWQPKNKDAELNIHLKGDPVQVAFQ